MKHLKLLTLDLTVAAAPVTFAATPMTGMFSSPSRTRASSAGKICL